MKIFCMSDIHGHLKEFNAAVQVVENEWGENDKLILLGDYVDGGRFSCQVIERIIELQARYTPDRVVALRGNHDQWLYDYFIGQRYFCDMQWRTLKTFLDEEQTRYANSLYAKGDTEATDLYVCSCAKKSHSDIIILIFYKSVDKVYRFMPRFTRQSKSKILTILVLNGFFGSFASPQRAALWI